MVTFGYNFIGQHMIIKVNAKLSLNERNHLNHNYPALCVKEIGKELTRIEGALNFNGDEGAHNFHQDLGIAITRSKIHFLRNKLQDQELALHKATMDLHELPF